MSKKQAAPFYPTYPQFVESLRAYTNEVDLLIGALETCLQIPGAITDGARSVLEERIAAIKAVRGD